MSRGNSHDWYFVGQANEHEFHSCARWHLKYRPEDPQGKLYREMVTEPLDKLPRHSKKFASTPTPDLQPRSTETDTGRKIHVHRKHRKNCPKHAEHVQRRGSSPLDGEEARIQELLLQQQPATIALQSRADELEAVLERPPKPLLPRLPVPKIVGHGLCSFLTGCYPGDLYRWQRRNQLEYLDFRKVAQVRTVEDDPGVASSLPKRKVKAQLKAKAMTQHTKAVSPDRIAEDLPDACGEPKLLKIDVDRTNFRKMYDMKRHMESAFSTGKSMMRC